MRVIRPHGIDSTIKLYLPFIGADAATVIRDYSQSHRAITTVADAQIDTAQYKFPPSSLLLDGTGDYLTAADSADWYLSTDSFQIGCFLRFAALPGAGVDMAFVCQTDNFNNSWGIRLYNSAGTYQWGFWIYEGGYTLNIAKDDHGSPAGLAINTWYYFEVNRSGNNFYLFRDGTQCGTTVSDANDIPDIGGSLYIGSGGTGASFMNGWMAEVLLRRGFAPHTANFTPPTRRLI